MSSDLLGVLLNWWSYRLLLPVYYWIDCRSKDMLLVCKGTHPSQTRLPHWSSGDANFSGVGMRPLIVVATRLLMVVETWLSMVERCGSWLMFEMRPSLTVETRSSLRRDFRNTKIALDASRRERRRYLGHVSGSNWAQDTCHISRPLESL